YHRTVDVAAGGESRFVVELAPTAETRQREDDQRQTRRLWGWSAAGGGLALAVGAGAYALATRHAVADAQRALDAQIAVEQNDTTNHCYAGPLNTGTYMFFHCGETKASLEDDVSAAKLKRDLAYAGVGLGLVAAGVGTYLLATSPARRPASASSTGVTVWSDGS